MARQSSSQNNSIYTQPNPELAKGTAEDTPRASTGIKSECVAFELRVQELLDRREAPEKDSIVLNHSINCEECHDLLRQFTQLESTLNLAFRPNRSVIQSESETVRPLHPVALHPVALQTREQIVWACQAAAVVMVCSVLFGWIASQQSRQLTLIPAAVNASASTVAQGTNLADSPAIRPASHYRSLEQCYELTSELPGVRPLQSSIQVAFSWWWDYLSLDDGETHSLPHHERGFGLNPLLADSNRRV